MSEINTEVNTEPLTVVIDGKEITNEAFVAGYSKVRAVSEEMVREGFCHP